MKLLVYVLTRLEVSFQCCASAEVLAALKLSRRHAGMRGYAYRIDTDDAVWHIADSDNPEFYNVIASPTALFLAENNFEEIEKQLREFLITELKIKNNTPLERIRRLDFSIDFISDSFIPDANNIYCPNRCKKKFKGNVAGVHPIQAVFLNPADLPEIIIGDMPYRQVSISKLENDVLRVTASAGKKELNKYDLRQFDDLKKVAGIFISILNDYRYVIPNNSENRSHWPLVNFWKTAINSVEKYFSK